MAIARIRVLIADDHKIVREGIEKLLGSERDIEVAGGAGDADTAVEAALRLKPDVVLMDLSMGESGMDGLKATREIIKRRPATRILCLTMHREEAYVTEMMDAGAAGYVLKDTSTADLAQAVRTVARGGTYLSPAVSGAHKPVASGGLTSRERDVIRLLAEGKSLKEVARVLRVSVKTADTHKTNLMRKLDLHDRAQLVRYALKHRLVGL